MTEREIAISETKLSEKTPRFRAKEYQLDFIAKMAASGVPAKAIENQAGVPSGYVNNLINNARAGKHEKFSEMLSGYQEKVTNKVGDHAFRLGDMLNDAYLAMHTALQSDDPKLAVETGEKVINMWQGAMGNTPGKSRMSESTVQIHNPEQVNLLISVQQEMNSHLKENISSIKQMPDVLNDPHIVTGEAALPTPEAQLEIKPGDALESSEPPLETTWYSETDPKDEPE